MILSVFALKFFFGLDAELASLMESVFWDEKKTVPEEEAPANYVPAAAVIRRERALSGMTGCKGSVGGMASQM